MISIEPTGPWIEPMIRARATDPRNGRPSWNRLAELAGVGTSTVTAMVRGTKKTSPDTVRKIARALRVTPEEVSNWIGLTRPVRERYEPPQEADLLTPRQRNALTELIRAIVLDDPEAGDGSGNATPTNPPPTLRSLPEVPALPEARAARRGRPHHPNGD